jgi:hypothetical protein
LPSTGPGAITILSLSAIDVPSTSLGATTVTLIPRVRAIIAGT